jgi:hypothetical protein
MYIKVETINTCFISLSSNRYLYYIDGYWSPVTLPPLDGNCINFREVLDPNKGLVFKTEVDQRLWYVDDTRLEPLEIKCSTVTPVE